MSEFEAKVLADLCLLNHQMMNLMEGTTGRLPVLEAEVARNRMIVERARGFAFGFGLLFAATQLLVDWFHR